MLSCLGWLLALLLTSYRYIWIHIWNICMTSKNSVNVSFIVKDVFQIYSQSHNCSDSNVEELSEGMSMCVPPTPCLKNITWIWDASHFSAAYDHADYREYSGSHCSKIILALGHYHFPVTVPMWLASHRPEQILASPNARLYSKEMCFGKRALIQHHSLFSQ